MKKLLSILFVGASIASFGQANIGIALTSPANNGTITAGTAFNFDVTVNNTGTLAVTTSDTILFAPTLNGSLIGTSTGGSLVYFSAAGLAAGATTNFTRSINLSGGQGGMVEVCGIVVMIGPNWNGVTESDTTDNSDCNMVTYNTNNVSLNEFTLVDLDNISDKSFFDGKVFHVDVRSAVVLKNPVFTLYSLTGQNVMSMDLTNSVSGIVEEINVVDMNLAPGIYVTQISTVDGAFQNSRKIIVR